MSTILQYPIQLGRTDLEMPEGSKVLTVQVQGDTPMLWAQVWAELPTRIRLIYVYTTGAEMPLDPGEYIASFQMNGGADVFHAFDATDVPYWK